MQENMGRDWIRWISVFMLVSLGFSLLTGFLPSTHESAPFEFFLGFWISSVVMFVAPGVIIGGILALAMPQKRLGIRVMIIINSLVIIMMFAGAVIQAAKAGLPFA